MRRTFLALSCGLILTFGSASAQQQSSSPKPANNTAGPSMTERAKDAAQTLGEKTKDAMGKVKDMAQEAGQKSKADGEQKAAQSGQSRGQSSKSERMQKQADADFKSAKGKCDSVEPRVQKVLCEKQAAAAHANAELRIAKANVTAQTGKTNTMGAGKAAR